MPTDLWFAEDKMYVRLDDGRELAVPVEWFPSLHDADENQRKNWRFIGEVRAFIGKILMRTF